MTGLSIKKHFPKVSPVKRLFDLISPKASIFLTLYTPCPSDLVAPPRWENIGVSLLKLATRASVIQRKFTR